jgi:hypothetical protein
VGVPVTRCRGFPFISSSSWFCSRPVWVV